MSYINEGTEVEQITTLLNAIFAPNLGENEGVTAVGNERDAIKKLYGNLRKTIWGEEKSDIFGEGMYWKAMFEYGNESSSSLIVCYNDSDKELNYFGLDDVSEERSKKFDIYNDNDIGKFTIAIKNDINRIPELVND